MKGNKQIGSNPELAYYRDGKALTALQPIPKDDPSSKKTVASYPRKMIGGVELPMDSDDEAYDGCK